MTATPPIVDRETWQKQIDTQRVVYRGIRTSNCARHRGVPRHSRRVGTLIGFRGN
jgi:hypothetical protein